MTTPPRVAVVGAGPGGLLCAHVLRRGGVDVTVLERDPSGAARDQGGTLDLHADTGQAALAVGGLSEAFAACARPEGQEFRQYDADGTLVEHEVPGPDDRSRPEIDRRDLRAMLLDAVGAVRWGTAVSGVVPCPGGGARVSTGDGRAEEFDLVVGADGTWSRVRPAVSGAVPAYTGSTLVEAWFTDVDRRHPEVAQLVGDGTLAAFDPADHRQAIIAQRNGDGRVRVYAALRDVADWLGRAGVDPADADAVTRALLARFEGWAPVLRALVGEHGGPWADRPIHALPVGHRWDHVPGITLLGDAAHVMPPAGEGANLALLDGAELAAAVVGGGDLDAAVRAYEEAMVPRAAAAAARSVAALAA